MKTRFDDYCVRATHLHDAKFIAPKGEAFIDAYNKGTDYRVKVQTIYPGGESYVRWGFVALTTGWKPSFMLMRQTGQRGSWDLIDERDTIIANHWIA